MHEIKGHDLLMSRFAPGRFTTPDRTVAILLDGNLVLDFFFDRLVRTLWHVVGLFICSDKGRRRC
jgi:hypothetical protein